MRKLIGYAAFALALGCAAAQAQNSDGTIKIGVLNDMSGLYSDLSGQGVGCRRPHGGRGFRRCRQRHEG
jgi:hypothetical protein